MINFLLGFIVGTFVTGYVYEQTRRPNVIQNSIDKIKKLDDSNVNQILTGERFPEFPPVQPASIAKPPRKKFLGIFKRKPKP